MEDVLHMTVLFWALSWLSTCTASNHTAENGDQGSGYKAPDVEAIRDKERIIGVCVGVGLAMVFLVVLCISYNYYKNKTVERKPSDEEEFKIKKPEFKSNTRAQMKGVDNATMDTRF